MQIGYARFSDDDQTLDLQRDALARAGCQEIFEDKERGRAGNRRPALEAALASMRPDDQLVVWKIDRLGRSLREMIETAHDLKARAVNVRLLADNIDTATASGLRTFNFLGTIAEYFLDLNRESIPGLKSGAARGRKGGRKRKLTQADMATARALLKDTTLPVARIATRLGVSRPTFYQYFPRARAAAMEER